VQVTHSHNPLFFRRFRFYKIHIFISPRTHRIFCYFIYTSWNLTLNLWEVCDDLTLKLYYSREKYYWTIKNCNVFDNCIKIHH